MSEDNYSEIQQKALEQLLTGKPLLGKDGALAPLLKQFLEAALEAEMDAHLTEEERNKGNGRGQRTEDRGQ